MRQPIRWDLYGDRGLALVDSIPIVGRDFTGAALTAHVKAVPDASGSPIISPTATLSYGGTDTVGNHIAAGRLSTKIYDYVNAATAAKYAPGDSIALSVIGISVSSSDMGTLVPPADVPGDDKVLAWNLLIDPAGGELQDKWIFGSFIVRGVC
jgi:hypothetical protein